MSDSRRESEASESSRRTSEVEEGPPSNVQLFNNVVLTEGAAESPIDINLSYATPFELPVLEWFHNPLLPKKMKINNTGHTVIISAKWHQERPFLRGGPFIGNYVFSQMHFHWGEDNREGSEHTVDGTRLPLEMHVVYFKSCYLTQEAALRKPDGVAILVYFYKLQGFDNPVIQNILDRFDQIKIPLAAQKMQNIPLAFFIKPFYNDYFLYWGSVDTSVCSHSIMFLINREISGVSVEQMGQFRTLLDINKDPLTRNFRSTINIKDVTVYHVNPSTYTYNTLLHFPKELRPGEAPPQDHYLCTLKVANPFKEPQKKYATPEDAERARKRHYLIKCCKARDAMMKPHHNHSACLDVPSVDSSLSIPGL